MDLLPKEKSKNVFLKIISVQCIFVIIIILGILIFKFTSPKAFSKIKEWHNQNIMTETSVSEVLGGEDNEI